MISNFFFPSLFIWSPKHHCRSPWGHQPDLRCPELQLDRDQSPHQGLPLDVQWQNHWNFQVSWGCCIHRPPVSCYIHQKVPNGKLWLADSMVEWNPHMIVLNLAVVSHWSMYQRNSLFPKGPVVFSVQFTNWQYWVNKLYKNMANPVGFKILTCPMGWKTEHHWYYIEPFLSLKVCCWSWSFIFLCSDSYSVPF